MTTQSNPREMLEPVTPAMMEAGKRAILERTSRNLDSWTLNDAYLAMKALDPTIERLNSELERKAEVVERILAISLRADLKPETKVAIIKDKARTSSRTLKPCDRFGPMASKWASFTPMDGLGNVVDPKTGKRITPDAALNPEISDDPI